MKIAMAVLRKFRLSTLFLVFLIILAASLLNCGEKSPQAPDDNINYNDTIPPAAITNLTVRTPTTTSITLVWMAPGDDGTTGQAAEYDIRYSSSLITEQNWDSALQVSGVAAPKPANQLETFIVNGLSSAEDHFFAIKTSDEEGNQSQISNCPMGTTAQELSPPAAITDLEASASSETEVLLTWTAPGDDGLIGTASQYDIRYMPWRSAGFNWSDATSVIGEPVPKPGGEPDSFIVDGLDPETNYYFAMMTSDEVPNVSEVSNVAFALGYFVYLLFIPNPVHIGNEVEVHFKASTSNVVINVLAYRHQPPEYYIIKHLVDNTFPPGTNVVKWDLTDDEGDPVSWGIQYPVILYWGEGKVDSVALRVLY
jgi:hypothetical protein